MGSCMSKSTTVAEEANPAPHPEARRVWLISTQVDPKDVPLDLVGIDADGLKAAMRNRGLEVEHWALKVDTPANIKSEPSIFDITLEGGKLVSQIHSTSSPYWKCVLRRVAIGWTIWKDDEILEASKLLIQARPKYDGRANNSQQLARLLGRHIEFVPPVQHQQQQSAMTTTSETVAGSATSPAGSILKPDLFSQEAGSTPANNRSQNTLVSGGHSQTSQSIESEPKETVGEMEIKVSRVPPSIQHSQRMSVARPLIHLSTAPSSAGSELGVLPPSRPTLHRSAETEQTPSPTDSVRMSLPPQPRQSPLNPSYRTHRQTASEIRGADGRARTKSDAASQHYATVGVDGRRMLKGGRRRSEAPAEWLAELPTANGSNSVRVRTKSSHQRDSVLSLGGGSVMGGMGGSWGPAMGAAAFPSSPSMMPGMPGMPMQMGGFGTPPLAMSPQMGAMGAMAMPMWPPQINTSLSMMFNPALQVPPMPPYFGQHPMGGEMPFLASMPMLAPPSPGFHSHTSSAVHTPPESPHLTTTQLPGKQVPDIRSLYHQNQQQRI
ncbi:hypothetical protein NDA16_004381 [Ustilago loliicola]|nr:hypothetical protein NDA16_004381 [Ustilago loliicola]